MAGLLVTSVIGVLGCYFRTWHGLPGSTVYRQWEAEHITEQRSWVESIPVKPTPTVTVPIVESSWFLDLTGIAVILALSGILGSAYFAFTALQKEHDRECEAQEQNHKKSLNRHKSESTRELSRHARTLEIHDTTLGQHAGALDNHAVTLDRHANRLMHHEARLNQQVNALLGQSNDIESVQHGIQELGDAVQGQAEAFHVQTQTLDAHTESLRRQSEAMESTQASTKRLADALDDQEATLSNHAETLDSQSNTVISVQAAVKGLNDVVHGDGTTQNKGLVAEVGEVAADLTKNTQEINTLKKDVSNVISNVIDAVDLALTGDGLSSKVDRLMTAVEGDERTNGLKSDVQGLFSAVKGTDDTKGLETQVSDVQDEVEILKASADQTAARLDNVHADLDKKLSAHSEEADAQRVHLSELKQENQASIDRVDRKGTDLRTNLLSMQAEIKNLTARFESTSQQAAEDVSRTVARLDSLYTDIPRDRATLSEEADTQKAKLHEVTEQIHRFTEQLHENTTSTREALYTQSARVDECLERIGSLEASTRGPRDEQTASQNIEALVAARVAEQFDRLRMELRLRESEQEEKLNAKLNHQALLQENAMKAFDLRILHIQRNQPGEVLNPRRSAPAPRAIAMNFSAIPQGSRNGSPMHSPKPFTGSPGHMNSHAGPVMSLSPVAPGFVSQSPTTAHDNWLNEHERRLMAVEAVGSENARGLGRITDLVRGHDNSLRSLRNRDAEIRHVRARLDDIDAAAFSFSTRFNSLGMQVQQLDERLAGVEDSYQHLGLEFVQDLAGHDVPKLGYLKFLKYAPIRRDHTRPGSPKNPEQGDVDQNASTEPTVAGEEDESGQLDSKNSTSGKTPTADSATEPTDAEDPSPSSSKVDPNATTPSTSSGGSNSDPAPASNPLTPGLGTSRWTTEPEEPARPSSTGNPRPNRPRHIRNERRRKRGPA